MNQRTYPLEGDDERDVVEKRRWVREHYSPETQYKYETLEGKLELLETILRNRWISNHEKLKLQCLGIAFGDALAQETGMEWITVEDEYGRDPALVLEGTSIIVFPLTSISKRIEAGEMVDVHELFASACASIRELRNEA